MTKSNVIALPQPGAFSDLLTEVLRTGARALLARAVEAETADFLEQYADLKTEDGVLIPRLITANARSSRSDGLLARWRI